MEGYRVYYDEDAKLFVAEEQPRQLNDKDKYLIIIIDFEAYYIDYNSAMKVAENLNQHLGRIRYCKDCGKKFWFAEDQEQWFKDHDLKEPTRCYSC